MFRFRFQINQGQHFTNGFRANIGGEGIHAIDILRIEELFFVHQLAIGEVREARFNDHIVFEIQDPLKVAQSHIQHQTNARRQRLQKPNMRNRAGQFDVAHPLAADLLQGHFHAAFLADNAAIFHALILAAQTFIIFDRAKDTRAEQAVPLGFERAIIDGFWLLNFTKRPRQDPLRAGQRDFDFIKGFGRRNRVKRVG